MITSEGNNVSLQQALVEERQQNILNINALNYNVSNCQPYIVSNCINGSQVNICAGSSSYSQQVPPSVDLVSSKLPQNYQAGVFPSHQATYFLGNNGGCPIFAMAGSSVYGAPGQTPLRMNSNCTTSSSTYSQYQMQQQSNCQLNNRVFLPSNIIQDGNGRRPATVLMDPQAAQVLTIHQSTPVNHIIVINPSNTANHTVRNSPSYFSLGQNVQVPSTAVGLPQSGTMPDEVPHSQQSVFGVSESGSGIPCLLLEQPAGHIAPNHVVRQIKAEQFFVNPSIHPAPAAVLPTVNPFTKVVKNRSNGTNKGAKKTPVILFQGELSTQEIACRVAMELKRYNIPQSVFAERVLGRSQGTLSDLLRNPKPWNKLKSGRETFCRMVEWLQKPESVRAEFLHSADFNHRMLDRAVLMDAQRTPALTLPKKTRLIFTDVQRRTLNYLFEEYKRPTKEMQAVIAEHLNLHCSTVANFFMNSRRRSVQENGGWSGGGNGNEEQVACNGDSMNDKLEVSEELIRRLNLMKDPNNNTTTRARSKPQRKREPSAAAQMAPQSTYYHQPQEMDSECPIKQTPSALGTSVKQTSSGFSSFALCDPSSSTNLFCPTNFVNSPMFKTTAAGNQTTPMQISLEDTMLLYDTKQKEAHSVSFLQQHTVDQTHYHNLLGVNNPLMQLSSSSIQDVAMITSHDGHAGSSDGKMNDSGMYTTDSDYTHQHCITPRCPEENDCLWNESNYTAGFP